MTRYMLVGDTHGNTGFWPHVFKLAKNVEADHIIQVGDFGVWPGKDGADYLNKIEKWAVKYGIDVTVVPGNHDDWDHILALPEDRMIRPHVKVFGKVGMIESDGVKIGCVGGAISIDREWRIPHKSYWPQEAITEKDVAEAMELGPVDVLITHDSGSDLPEWPGFIKDDLWSEKNRNALTAIEDVLRPTAWVHGHYHRALDYRTRTGCKVIGLDSEPQGYNGSNSGTPNVSYWMKAKPLAVLETFPEGIFNLWRLMPGFDEVQNLYGN